MVAPAFVVMGLAVDMVTTVAMRRPGMGLAAVIAVAVSVIFVANITAMIGHISAPA